MTALEDLTANEIEVTLAHEKSVRGDLEKQLNAVSSSISKLESELARRAYLAKYSEATMPDN